MALLNLAMTNSVVQKRVNKGEICMLVSFYMQLYGKRCL
jgi:hypothetical protein